MSLANTSMELDELQYSTYSILDQFSVKLQELKTLANQMPSHLKPRAQRSLDECYAEIKKSFEINSLTKCFGEKDLTNTVLFSERMETEVIHPVSETVVNETNVEEITSVSKAVIEDFTNHKSAMASADISSDIHQGTIHLAQNTNFITCSSAIDIQPMNGCVGLDSNSATIHNNYSTLEETEHTLIGLSEAGPHVSLHLDDASISKVQETSDESNAKPDVSSEREDCSKDDLNDMSSLLTFLPQLSPYIKFDMKDGPTGSDRGFLHLTVERADGSVQNLKVGGVVAAGPSEILPELVMEKDESIPDTIVEEEGKTETADGQEKEIIVLPVSPGDNEVIEVDMLATPRSRGRPKKQAKYQPQTDEHGTKVYICSICGASVKSEHALTVHLRKHSGDRPFSCQYCGKTFTTKGNAKAHEATHSEEKPWTCQYCQKSFKEKKVLKIHLRKHTGEKPFKCTMCEKAFTQKSVLTEHILVHTGQKPHLCDLCGQEFRGLSSLRAHTLRHMNKRDYKCDKCEKDFVSKNDLNRHYMTHTGARPFACHICPKTFTRLNYLKEHLNVHSGCKPFSCQICNTSFADTMSLHRHKRKHRLEEEEEDGEEKIVFQSELEKELLSAGHQSVVADDSFHKIEISDSSILAESSVQVILDENTKADDLQRLQSLVLSAASNVDFTFNLQQTSKQLGHVMCVNPDTQDITDSVNGHQLIITGQNAADFSAINLLAAATAQQYNI